MEYTVGSLFAGVGGICLGFKDTTTAEGSYKLIWANEIDEYACETYRNNFKHQLLEGDIEMILHPARIDGTIALLRKQILEEKNEKKGQTLEKKLNDILQERDNEFGQFTKNGILPKWIKKQNKEDVFKKYVMLREQILLTNLDILVGGFPCQAFSIAGERNGFKDPRGNLFLCIVDLIEMLGEKHTVFDCTGKIVKSGKPRILFLENVKNLKSHDGGNTYKTIKKGLEDCGYTVFEKVINTMDYSDLPQNRERMYIIGFRDDVDARKFDLFNEAVLSKYRVEKSILDRQKDMKNVIDYSLTMENGGQYYYTSEKYPNYFVEDKINLEKDIDTMYEFYQVRRSQYVRKNKSNVCPTLTANMGTGGHNVPLIKVRDGVRKITPQEAFRLQGFPIGRGYTLPQKYKGKTYADSHLYKQAGNAVSVPIIKMIAEYILNLLEEI